MRGTLFVVLLAAGCGRIGFDPLGEGGGRADGGGRGGGGGSDGSSGACPQVAQCPDRMGNAHLGMTNISSMVQLNHGLSSGMCSSGINNPELAVLFDVDEDATYTINVTGGAFAVYIQDGCCGGTELRCGVQPFTLPRRAGERFVVLVEGLTSASYTVSVTGS